VRVRRCCTMVATHRRVHVWDDVLRRVWSAGFLSDRDRRVLHLSSLIYDVGKIAVPDRILCKPGPLTADEMAGVRKHVVYGVSLIRSVLEDDEVAGVVAGHHEHWDGSGYPSGLAGADIPLLCRVLHIADAASAMVLDRPYREALPWPAAEAQLCAASGSHFNPVLLELFLAAARPFFGTIEIWAHGETAG
jgi:HD-GYP domain-containing protein (c-di-GMP phosphodiesterase class II)